MKIRLVILAFLLVINLSGVHAQDAFPPGETPEAVAQQYVDAMRASDWAKCATLMHPAALKGVRGLFEPIAEMAKGAKDQTQFTEIFGIKSKEELAQLSDQEVFAKFMGAITSLVPDMRNILNSSSMDVLGRVAESTDLQHVVYRMKMKIEMAGVLDEPIPFNKLDVMTLRRWENTWRMDLKGDMEGMMKAMTAGMAKRAQEPPTAEDSGKTTEEKPKTTRKKRRTSRK